MAAWVSRSPPYTSPRGLRTEISTIKSAMVKTISATSTLTKAMVHRPCHANHGALRRLPHTRRHARHVISVPTPLGVPRLEGALSTRDSKPYRRLQSRPAAPTAIESQSSLNLFSPQDALIGKQQARKRGGDLHSNTRFCFA